MSAQHTPGPWSVTNNNWETSTVYGRDGETIAACQINSIVTEDTQYEFEAIKEANARLIAAAPELLEALEHLLKVRTREGVKPQSRDAAEAKSRAAIAKATGAA